jgi:hypothetical protein
MAAVLTLEVLASAPASAQDAGPQPTKFSIGAFIGYRGGGSGTDTSTGNGYQLASAQDYGLVADFRVSPDTEVEVQTAFGASCVSRDRANQVNVLSKIDDMQSRRLA